MGKWGVLFFYLRVHVQVGDGIRRAIEKNICKEWPELFYSETDLRGYLIKKLKRQTQHLQLQEKVCAQARGAVRDLQTVEHLPLSPTRRSCLQADT